MKFLKCIVKVPKGKDVDLKKIEECADVKVVVTCPPPPPPKYTDCKPKCDPYKGYDLA